MSTKSLTLLPTMSLSVCSKPAIIACILSGIIALSAPGLVAAKNLQIDLTNQVGTLLVYGGGDTKYGNISEFSPTIEPGQKGSVRGTHKYQADKAVSLGAGGFFYSDASKNGLQIQYVYKYDEVSYCYDVDIKVVPPSEGTGIIWRYKLEKARSSSNSGCHRYYNVVPCGTNECK